jgi:AcrR family transcriptional regulator
LARFPPLQQRVWTIADSSRACVQEPALPPTSAPPRQDRRVQRTRGALLHALMSLMAERGWDEIDVQSLCGRANIGRSTFYQHFPNKEELLKQSLDGLREWLMSSVSPASNGTEPLGFVLGLLTHVHEQREVFKALVGRRSGQYVQERFRELLVELLQSSNTSGKTRGWQDSARAHYLAGALFELMVWWLASNRPQRAEEVAATFKRWSASALEPAALGSTRLHMQ